MRTVKGVDVMSLKISCVQRHLLRGLFTAWGRGIASLVQMCTRYSRGCRRSPLWERHRATPAVREQRGEVSGHYGSDIETTSTLSGRNCLQCYDVPDVGWPIMANKHQGCLRVRRVSNSYGSGRIRSGGGVWKLTSRVESGEDVLKGPGRVKLRMKKSHGSRQVMTREKLVMSRIGPLDPRVSFC